MIEELLDVEDGLRHEQLGQQLAEMSFQLVEVLIQGIFHVFVRRVEEVGHVGANALERPQVFLKDLYLLLLLGVSVIFDLLSYALGGHRRLDGFILDIPIPLVPHLALLQNESCRLYGILVVLLIDGLHSELLEFAFFATSCLAFSFACAICRLALHISYAK